MNQRGLQIISMRTLNSEHIVMLRVIDRNTEKNISNTLNIA